MLTLNVIGCGRLAKTLVALFLRKKLVKLLGVYNRTDRSTKKSVSWLQQGQACRSLDDLPPSDLYMITTPDNILPLIADQLAQQSSIRSNSIVFHCSGMMSSDCLQALKKRGCFIASVHPIHSFFDPRISMETFQNSFCGFEGQRAALKILMPLFQQIGARSLTVSKRHKAIYHAAAVFCSNYVITLAAMAEQCYRQAHIKKDLARELVLSLMTRGLISLQTTSYAKALTGPLQRGDINTVMAHRRALADFPKLSEAYQLFAQNTLSILKPRKDI
jgi:predicted short-subunit dehydrogenase-like oxidoreductase (DUF2520 family)